MLREEPDREVTEEPDGPLFPTVQGHELILILRIAHQVEGRYGTGEPTPAKDLVGGRVEVASRSWRRFHVVGSMALGNRRDTARRPNRRNATAPRLYFVFAFFRG